MVIKPTILPKGGGGLLNGASPTFIEPGTATAIVISGAWNHDPVYSATYRNSTARITTPTI